MTQDTISKERKVKSYRWWRDTKMIGTFVLLISITMQVFAWIDIPFFTTIHGYTVGMMFGNFNPFFYFYMIYLGASMILDEKINFPKWVKITRISYWFVALSIIFVSVSLGHYQNHTGYGVWGSDSFGAFNKWFEIFTSETWYLPVDTLGGILGATMYSFFAMIFSGIGAIVLAIFLLIVSASVLITGTSLGLYRDLIKKNNVRDGARLEKETDTFEIESIVDQKPYDPFDETAEPPKQEIEVPFDDPFE